MLESMVGKSNKEIWIFLSHSSADFDKVRLIRNYLEEKSFRPLMFYLKCLNSDEETYELIKREIDVRTRFVLCDSENARASEWVKKEMEYISSSEPKRTYEILDLSKPIETLKNQLDFYTNKTNVYISYSRYDKQLCEDICKRLAKYDLNVLCDYEFLNEAADYTKEIKKNIQHAANNGYFVALCSDNYVNSKYCIKEFQFAHEVGANIIFVVLSERAHDYLINEIDSTRTQTVINLSNSKQNIDSDDVTDAILQVILSAGARMTYAVNMRIGKFSQVDKIESDRLYKKLIEEAEESSSPGALRFMGRCYEEGLGVEKDLKMASSYYSEYIHSPEINCKVDDAFLEHVRALNMEIYGNINSPKPVESKFHKYIKRLLGR